LNFGNCSGVSSAAIFGANLSRTSINLARLHVGRDVFVDPNVVQLLALLVEDGAQLLALLGREIQLQAEVAQLAASLHGTTRYSVGRTIVRSHNGLTNCICDPRH
jgi:hypothetical protein